MSATGKEIKLTDQLKPGLFRWRLWTFKVTGKNGRFVECNGIHLEAVSQYLYSNGIRHDNFKRYYQLQDNVVRELKLAEVADMVVDQAKRVPKDTMIIFNGDTEVASTRDQIISATHETIRPKITTVLNLKHWSPDTAKWCTDTIDKCFLFFKNGVVEITKKAHRMIKYADIPGYIWEKQIVQREFKFVKRKSSIAKFLDMAIGRDHRVEYTTALGYMVHTYINNEGCPILFCIDHNLSALNEGGNGKDFFGQIIGQVRKVDMIEGKQMTDNNRFIFESINADTQIAWFRDIKKTFKMESMYNLTEGNGIQVRQINRDPFRVKAKVGVSLQHSIDVEGRSDERRQAFLFFTDEIGNAGGVGKALKERSIFSEAWGGDWDAFYSMIVSCVQVYLHKGLVKMNTDRLKQIRVDEISEHYELDKLELGKFYSWSQALEILTGDININQQKVYFLKQDLYRWVKNMGYNIALEKKMNSRGFTITSLSVYTKRIRRHATT